MKMALLWDKQESFAFLVERAKEEVSAVSPPTGGSTCKDKSRPFAYWRNV